MDSWGWQLTSGLLFLLIGLMLLANVVPVWWSIASVIIVFSAVALLLSRALVGWRRARTDP